MSLNANSIITGVAGELNDPKSVRWTLADKVRYLNLAQRMVVLVRPDANSTTQAVKLVAGTKQSIPNDGLVLLDFVRNMGADGLTPGYPVRETDRKVLDSFNRLWHKASGKSFITEYSFDDRVATDFYVTPPVSSTVDVWGEIVYSKTPTVVLIDALDVTLDLADVYEVPIREWMKREAFAKEISSQASVQMSARFEQSFYQALGIKWQADKAVSPNNDEGPQVS